MNNEEFKEFIKEDLQKSFYEVTYDDKYNLLEFEGRVLVEMNDLDVNWSMWHHYMLEGHKTFDFDGCGCVYLKPDNYEEFKQVLRDYKKEYIKGEQ